MWRNKVQKRKVKGGCLAAMEKWEVKATLMLEEDKTTQDQEIREERSLVMTGTEGMKPWLLKEWITWEEKTYSQRALLEALVCKGLFAYYSLSPLLENWLSSEGSNGNFIGLLIGNQQIWILVVKSLGYGSGISDFDSPQTYHLLAGLPLANCITPMSLGFLLCKFRIVLVLGRLFWGLTTTQNVCA